MQTHGVTHAAVLCSRRVGRGKTKTGFFFNPIYVPAQLKRRMGTPLVVVTIKKKETLEWFASDKRKKAFSEKPPWVHNALRVSPFVPIVSAKHNRLPTTEAGRLREVCDFRRVIDEKYEIFVRHTTATSAIHRRIFSNGLKSKKRRPRFTINWRPPFVKY